MNQNRGMECLEAKAGKGAGAAQQTALARGQFTFYASFFQALDSLPKSRQLETYRAIAQYALYGLEPKLSGASESVFSVVRPVLDASRSKAEAMLRRQTAERGADVEKKVESKP